MTRDVLVYRFLPRLAFPLLVAAVFAALRSVRVLVALAGTIVVAVVFLLA